MSYNKCRVCGEYTGMVGFTAYTCACQKSHMLAAPPVEPLERLEEILVTLKDVISDRAWKIVSEEYFEAKRIIQGLRSRR